MKTPEKIENVMVGTFNRIENGIVFGYKKLKKTLLNFFDGK